MTEVVALLAELTSDLRQALRIAARKAYVIMDGTLVTTDRLPGANDRLYPSGKHRRHGVNIQFLTDPHGELIWASPALPGSTHDLTVARDHGMVAGLTARAVRLLRRQGVCRCGWRDRHTLQAQEAPRAGNARSCSTDTTQESAP
ncbi:transposase [Actinomadura graeca]|uniref:Transposase n=1 Tax=Actinomadura graeca TaxID=2750812 RepID=A0ABX8R0U6_9ACTN|nr:transposase family protein [Actinomadura graeca]QXJ24064.1 transposase [Actinomadura graeca]